MTWWRQMQGWSGSIRRRDRWSEAAAAAGGLPITPEQARGMLDAGMTREQIRERVLAGETVLERRVGDDFDDYPDTAAGWRFVECTAENRPDDPDGIDPCQGCAAWGRECGAVWERTTPMSLRCSSRR